MTVRERERQAAREKRMGLLAYRQQTYRISLVERRLKEINDRAAQSFREKRA